MALSLKLKIISLKQSFYVQLPANIHLSLYPKKLGNMTIIDGTKRKSPNRISAPFYSPGIYTSPLFNVPGPTGWRGGLGRGSSHCSAPLDREPDAAPVPCDAERGGGFLQHTPRAHCRCYAATFRMPGESWRLVSKDIYTFYRRNTEPSKK